MRDHPPRSGGLEAPAPVGARPGPGAGRRRAPRRGRDGLGPGQDHLAVDAGRLQGGRAPGEPARVREEDGHQGPHRRGAHRGSLQEAGALAEHGRPLRRHVHGRALDRSPLRVPPAAHRAGAGLRHDGLRADGAGGGRVPGRPVRAARRPEHAAPGLSEGPLRPEGPEAPGDLGRAAGRRQGLHRPRQGAVRHRRHGEQRHPDVSLHARVDVVPGRRAGDGPGEGRRRHARRPEGRRDLSWSS